MPVMRAPKGLEKAGAAELGGNVTAVGVNPFLPDFPSEDPIILRMLETMFRGKDLSKVLPAAKSVVPEAPGTAQTVSSAFQDYLAQIGKLLGR